MGCLDKKGYIKMKNKITNIIATFWTESSPLQPETSLLKTGILNSIDLISLISDLEKEFNINIPAEDVDYENFDSINNIETFINSKLKS